MSIHAALELFVSPDMTPVLRAPEQLFLVAGPGTRSIHSKIGNSHGLMFDAAVMDLAHLKAGDQVNVEVHEGGTITLTPLRPKPSRAEVSRVIKATIRQHRRGFEEIVLCTVGFFSRAYMSFTQATKTLADGTGRLVAQVIDDGLGGGDEVGGDVA